MFLIWNEFGHEFETVDSLFNTDALGSLAYFVKKIKLRHSSQIKVTKKRRYYIR